jgi:hypothetical protein
VAAGLLAVAPAVAPPGRPLLRLRLLPTAAPAVAQAPQLDLAATARETGWVALRVRGPAGTPVRIDEATGEHVADVTLGAKAVRLARAAAWRCDRRSRSFVATAADGRSAQASVDTPSCRDRLLLSVRPRAPRAGRPVTLLVRDRWSLGGIGARVCAATPGAPRRCRDVTLAPGSARAAFRFHPRRAGRWRVTLTAPRVRRRLRAMPVRRASDRLTVLATGDSMIQILDGFLKQRIERRGRRVLSDAHISTGISKPFMLDWVRHAQGSAHGVHPDVTVVFLGANDGYPIGGAQCCGRSWVRGYAKRAGRMMGSYARAGAGTVYWLLLPVPGRASFQPVFRAVNAALRIAARSRPGVVRLVDLAKVFTPGGRFRASMRWQGRTQVVRQDDRVHLSVAGASIAATVILRAMRRDGVL